MNDAPAPAGKPTAPSSLTSRAAITPLALVSLWFIAAPVARAQGIDLTQGGPILITAQNGMEWRQAEQVVIANGDAKAVRGTVTVTANRLQAWYRKKQQNGSAPAAPQPVTTGLTGEADTAGNEVYRLRAEGHVHIFTATDQAWGDQATYDLDQSVLVMTGDNDLKLVTPNDTLTARDTLEYWSEKHMAVARGDAVVVTNDGRRISADTLVAYTHPAPTAPPHSAGNPAGAPASPEAAAPSTTDAAKTQTAGQSANPTGDPTVAMAGRLERVDAFGNVTVRTATDIVIGDRGVYVPDTGIAHLGGHVRITRGLNQINGAEAVVNMKTGVATLLSGDSGRVSGLVVPNDQSNPSPASTGAAGLPETRAKDHQPKRGANQ